jgi:hypothetical protein
MSFVSETSQYWKNLSYMIIFGLPLGTVLTLVVVPTIYSIIETAPQGIKKTFRTIKEWYWKPFEAR